MENKECLKDRVIGVDLSLNHGAVVVLDSGQLTEYAFVSNFKTIANMYTNGTYLGDGKIKDMHVRSVSRLEFWYKYIMYILDTYNPEYWGIEDYAYRASMNSHQIGEVGGVARLVPWSYGVKLRMHGPESIKLFVSHSGNASKDDIKEDCLERWPETNEFCEYSTNKNTTTSEDLFDAYGVARLLWTEVLIKRGEMHLEGMHEKEIRVFNRVTKRWSENLLARDWVQRNKK